MEVKRIFDLLDFIKEKYNKENCIAGKKSGKWIIYSIDQYREIVDQISYGLLNMGIDKGDKVATMSNNRPEWNFVDMAIMQIGAIHVPVYPTITDAEFVYIMNEAEVKLVFVSSNVLYNKVSGLKDQLLSVKHFYCFDQVPNAVNIQELRESGKNNPKETEVDQLRSAVGKDDVATIIYTSGTMLKPKGVMLSHTNIVSNFSTVAPSFKMDETFTGLSYLPLCHVYERMLNYMYQYIGVSVYYAESVASIIDNFGEVKPNVLTTVPLLLEKIYASILAKGSQLSGMEKNVFDQSIQMALKYDIGGQNSPEYLAGLKKMDEYVYSKWRAFLGGQLKIVICGGAALQPDLLKVFWAAGIPVYEGYGLTETSPVISNNSLVACKLGTVGKILDNVEVKIAEDGEILCKGPSLMKGYYKNPALTAEAIDQDGWFHTGDIGLIEDKIFLKLTGRKKALFKTTSGMYISPENIENSLKQSPFVSQALIVGANQNYLSALIVPDFNFLSNWCQQNNITYSTPEEAVKQEKILEKFSALLDDFNRNAKDTEQILKFKLLEKDWTIESGELTPKMSVKRNVVCDRYKTFIDAFYAEK